MAAAVVGTYFSVAVHANVTKETLTIQLRFRHTGTVPAAVVDALSYGTIIAIVPNVTHTRSIGSAALAMPTAIVFAIFFQHAAAIYTCVAGITLTPFHCTYTAVRTIVEDRS